jgi:hypothetical protein
LINTEVIRSTGSRRISGASFESFCGTALTADTGVWMAIQSQAQIQRFHRLQKPRQSGGENERDPEVFGLVMTHL